MSSGSFCLLSFIQICCYGLSEHFSLFNLLVYTIFLWFFGGWDSCHITTNFLHFSAFLWNFFEIYKFYHPKNHKSIRTKAVKFLFSVTAFCLFLKSFTVRLMNIFEFIWGICHDFSVLDTSSVQIFSYGIVKEQKFQ